MYTRTITKPDQHEQAWWSRIKLPCEVTVTETLDRYYQIDLTEWQIVGGEHHGKIIDRACCSQPEVKESEVA